jgi:hypothetical protein
LFENAVLSLLINILSIFIYRGFLFVFFRGIVNVKMSLIIKQHTLEAYGRNGGIAWHCMEVNLQRYVTKRILEHAHIFNVQSV